MYLFEYAPTGRAKCVECNVCIEKGSIRVSAEEKASSHASVRFLHLNCWKVPENVATMKGLSLDKLSVADQQKIVEYINENKPKEEKTSDTSAALADVPKVDSNSEANVETSPTKRAEEENKRPKRATKKSKKTEELPGDTQTASTQAEASTAAQSPKDDSSSEEEEEEEEELVLRPLTEADKQQRKQQEKMIEQEMSKMSNLTVEQLKSELKKNDQSTSGTKHVLLSRVADGRIRGAIPRCPKCAGGRLRMNAKDLVYHYTCPGFHDDEEFQHCNFAADYDNITRLTWKS